jgi:hypothetical protein
MKFPADAAFQVLTQLKETATNAGLACDVPDCTKFTLGFSCGMCARKLCNGHGYWQVDTRGPPSVYCPFCVVECNRSLWEW